MGVLGFAGPGAGVPCLLSVSVPVGAGAGHIGRSMDSGNFVLLWHRLKSFHLIECGVRLAPMGGSYECSLEVVSE